MGKSFQLSASPLEVILFMLFVAYLVFQPSTPPVLRMFVDNMFGTIVVIVFALYMFLYMHPILGVLSIFVAYELIRRNSTKILQYSSIAQPIRDAEIELEPIRDAEIERMSPPNEGTLEESMVAQMAPIGDGRAIAASYVPVSNDVRGASMI
jgi:uncharacterized membrane protein